MICLLYHSNREYIVYDRSVRFVYNTVCIVNTVSMIGLFELSTISF